MNCPLGNTPLIDLSREGEAIFGKAEWQNPAGSVKDRTAEAMLRRAEARGLLPPGGTVVEATSGNTGIALAALCAARGYGCIIVMPANMSRERIALLRAYGARVELTDPATGMASARERAEGLARDLPGSYFVDQFANPANPAAHFASTGPEIWRQAQGNVDIFLAGVGTGGTLTGAGRYLKLQDPKIKILAVTGRDIPGLRAGFSPPLLDDCTPDGWITVTAEEACGCVRRTAQEQGLLLGISAGAALHAARLVAGENHGKRIITVLPDSGERYLSCGIF